MVGLGDTKLKILERLRQSEASVAVLVDELGISRVAIHRHLEDLSQDGLIRAKVAKCEGRGRPKQVYVAVDEQAPYAKLCTEVLAHLSDLFGSGAVLAVLSRRSNGVFEHLWPCMQSLNLEQRLHYLASYLTEQGYQARVYREGEQFYLEQGRCPKLALSSQFAEFCQSEIELYRALLQTEVVREERIASGGDCCRYRVVG